MNEFNILEKIGEGAHGVVLKAKSIKTGQIVALKKVSLRNPENKIPTTIIREIKALEQLNHPNVIFIFKKIVRLLNVFPSGIGFVLCFELMSFDLSQVIRDSLTPLTEAQIKTYMLMILKGVEYCHKCSIIHRDLKPANLLISKNRVLKLADFGLARVYEPNSKRPYSHQVATRLFNDNKVVPSSRITLWQQELWVWSGFMGCGVHFWRTIKSFSPFPRSK